MLLFVLIAVCCASNIPTTKSSLQLEPYLKQIRSKSCNYTEEMCQTCKSKITTQKDYCDHPLKDDQMCICKAFRRQWRIYFEDVEDTIRTSESACAVICSNGTVTVDNSEQETIPTNVTSTVKTGLVSDGATMKSLVLALAFIIFLF
ncbi:Transmembrane protein [Entamoeba marina]